MNQIQGTTQQANFSTAQLQTCCTSKCENNESMNNQQEEALLSQAIERKVIVGHFNLASFDKKKVI